MQETYTVKELILATRNEYQKIEEKLRLLKSYTYTNDERIQDYYFWVFKLGKKEIYIDCDFIENNRNFKLIKDKIRIRTNEDSCFLETKMFNTNLIESVVYKYRIYIKDNYLSDFKSIVKDILALEFINKFKSESLGAILPEKNIFLNFTPSYIGIDNYHIYHALFKYIPKDDLIKLTYENKQYLSSDIIIDLLNLSFPSEFLSDYHKELINNSLFAKKEIEIINEPIDTNHFFKNSITTNFSIEEKGDKFILRKVKK